MLRRAERIVAVFVYSLCIWLCVAACGRRTPELMAISGLTPTSVTENDLITLAGEGFVLGPEANVRFMGEVFRPGKEVESVDFRMPGSAVDGENLELVVSDIMLEHLCGHEDEGVAHATFRGEVEASFAPRTKGAPPIVGRTRNVELDVFRSRLSSDVTPPTPAKRAQPRADGVKSELLGTLGLVLQENASSRLEVAAVEQSSRASASGMQVGDELLRWSGVSVFSTRDIGVHPGQRVASVSVKRQGHAAPVELAVSVDGLSPLGARGWDLGLVLLGVLIVAVLVTRSQLSQWLVWLAIAKPQARRAAVQRYGVLPFLCVSALFLALAIRRDAVPFELDLLVLGLLTSLCLALFGVGCAYTDRGFSLRALFRVWFRQLPLHLAFALTLCALVLERGHARVWELAAPQGFNPLSYGAFASPPGFLVAGVWIATSAATAVTAPSRVAGPRFLWACARGCGDAASLCIAALVLAVFLGGWSTSAHAPSELGWAQASYFQLRFTLLFFAFGFLRRYVPTPPMASVSAWAWRMLVPAACFALLLLPVWWAEIWPAWVRVGAKGFLLGVACVVALGLPLATVALRRFEGNTGRRTGLNPWL